MVTQPQHERAETGSIRDIETIYREHYTRYLRFAVANLGTSARVVQISNATVSHGYWWRVSGRRRARRGASGCAAREERDGMRLRGSQNAGETVAGRRGTIGLLNPLRRVTRSHGLRLMWRSCGSGACWQRVPNGSGRRFGGSGLSGAGGTTSTPIPAASMSQYTLALERDAR